MSNDLIKKNLSNNRIIRKLSLVDLGEIYELLQKQSADEKNWNQHVDSNWLKSELVAGVGLGCFLDSSLLGALFFRDQPDNLEIMFLQTDLDFRKMGVMSNIWLKFLEKNTENKPIWLEVHQMNLPAQSFYLKNGFQISGRREKYYRDGKSAILMENLR